MTENSNQGGGSCATIVTQGKCKLIANFSATMVTSLPSHYFRLSLSLSHRAHLTHALPIIGLRSFVLGPEFSIFRRAARATWKSGNKEGEKNFWQRKVWTHCQFQRHSGDLFVNEETGSVKGETKARIFGKGKCKLIANCANFWQGKCKFIANFSATMVTSLPSLSLSLSLSLPLCLCLSPSVPHA